MTEGQMLFVLVILLGLLVIIGIVDRALCSRDDERRRNAPKSGENLPRRR